MIRKIFEFFDLETTRQLICIGVPMSLMIFIMCLCSAPDETDLKYSKVEFIEYVPVPNKEELTAENTVDAFENINKHNIASRSKNYKMSKNAHEFIKSFEKCKLNAYRIPGEKYNTIGWGHYLDEKHEQGIKKITQARADELFAQDIAWVDKAVTDMLNDVNPNYKWPQGIVDGLGSLVYNCGERGVRTTEFYRRLQNCRFHNGEINASDIAYTLAAVKKTRCTKPGHYKRRAGEYAMMNEKFI